jgi:cytochrome c peroxidase
LCYIKICIKIVFNKNNTSFMKKIWIALLPVSMVLMATTIHLNQLDNYAGQTLPAYITKDQMPANNPITNGGATLGRVLFYDKALSANQTISCASCHKQAFAFGDTAVRSVGLTQGLTGRHSMRLINTRFADETHFFWDERASSLENQTTQPIQDHIEMGFSGQNGQPDLDSLRRRLSALPRYQILFPFVFGDSLITEQRIQFALAQFIRSIQSFDSKFDQGLAQTNNLQAPFPNFTQQENQGKALFLNPPPQGGAGCQGCHRAPEFDIDPNTGNNGVTAVAGNPNQDDFTNTRAPSLRDVFNPNGNLNGPLMHNGNFTSALQVINHYNAVPQNPQNPNLDQRLQGPGGNLNLNTTQKDALVAFLKTLTGSNVYTDPKWSDPFDAQGQITIVPLLGIPTTPNQAVSLYPQPAQTFFRLSGLNTATPFICFDLQGKNVMEGWLSPDVAVDVSHLQPGSYVLVWQNTKTQSPTVTKLLIQR